MSRHAGEGHMVREKASIGKYIGKVGVKEGETSCKLHIPHEYDG